jgi:hypothetical protein
LERQRFGDGVFRAQRAPRGELTIEYRGVVRETNGCAPTLHIGTLGREIGGLPRFPQRGRYAEQPWGGRRIRVQPGARFEQPG